ACVGKVMLVLRWLLVSMLVANSPVQARWLRAETPSFIVYSQGDEASLRKHAAALQTFDALLRMITGIKTAPSPTKVSVFVVSDNSEMRPFGIGGAALGVYMKRPGGIALFVGRNEYDAFDSGTAVLFHEYAHHFMFQYAAASYPKWYVEGFAEYVMTARLTEGVAELGRFDSDNAYVLKSQAWMTLESLIAPGSNRGRANRSDMFYPQAWITVPYMNADPARRVALGRYLAALARGDDAIKAFEPAFGMSLMQFQAGLHDYSRSSDLALHRIKWSPPPADIKISVLPDSADKLLLLDLALALGGDSKNDRLLADTRSAAAKWGHEDAYAQRVLAHAEIQLGDLAVGQALLDGLIAASPDDAGLMHLRGLALSRAAAAADITASQAAARRKSARVALARANALRPDDFGILYAHVAASELPLSDAEYAVLLRVRELAPQVNEIGLVTAQRQIERDDIDAARKLLSVIASDTHDRSASEAAAALLTKLDAAPAAPLAPAAPSGH
ncbi:MAG: hypothetical protein ACRCUI_13660, partial [Polymorphobacter sp.]